MINEVPTIAIAMGDPAGIGGELAAKVLTRLEEIGPIRVIIVGDPAELANGARSAGVVLTVPTIQDPEDLMPQRGHPVLLDVGHSNVDAIPKGIASAASGAFAMRNFGVALDLAQAGKADAICFTPFNKEALKLAGNPYKDEIHWAADRLSYTGRCSEFNRLDNLWNARVTSHIPMAEVCEHLSRQAVLDSLRDADATIRHVTGTPPRIAVAGYNPHAGEGGLFGREEIDSIGPAIEDAKREGISADGPFPADTVWLRAKAGDFDTVLTMYHDQGQIALKLLGFNRGVTLLSGLPVPICTPAHGTAYEIVGQGKADAGATMAALSTVAALASKRNS